MRSFVILILYFLAILPVNAQLVTSEPNILCGLLSNSGLTTSGWKNYYDDNYGCSSPYKEFGSGASLANNLAFYAEGTSNSAKQVKLVLNINNRASASSAHQELVKLAITLSKKATGEKLPQALQDAIRNGQSASQKVGSAMVEVVKEEWTTGKGYEVKVIIN